MKHVLFFLSLVFLGSFFLSGCDLAQPQNKGQGEPPVVQNDPPPEEVPPNQPAQNEPAQSADNTVTVTAAPGMTDKGRYASAGNTSNPMSIISTPISVMFRTQDRLILQQVDAGMNYFKAENGRAPATHEEFMEKIIRANNIKLPQLPTGRSYVYEGGELKIRHPKDTP